MNIYHNNNSGTDYTKPFLMLVFLFFIVGFLTTANGQLEAPLKSIFLEQTGALRNTSSTLITFSWFMAYPLTGKMGARWVTIHGYKITLIRGLLIMVAGLLIFYCSSLFTVRFPNTLVHIGTTSIPYGFFIFLAGSFITGMSATILQVVINPYLTACYVKGTQPIQRLVIGGAANAFGNTVAPYVVAGVVFGGMSTADIKAEQLLVPFFALVAVMCMITLAVSKLSLPDIHGTRAGKGEKLLKSVWSFRHFTLGVIAIFFYVGVEVSVGANINLYVEELKKGNDHISMFGKVFSMSAFAATLYWSGELVGRLFAGFLKKTSPKAQLITTGLSACIVIGLAVIFDNAWLLALSGLCHSIMWGAIFTLSVNGLGKYTSVATGVFMSGVIGGAILPLVQGAAADLIHTWRWTWLIIIAGEVYILYYALIGSKVKESEILPVHS